MAGQALTVDRIRCDGHGLCADLFPEMVRLDDWGYPVVDAGPVPARLLGHARRAVKSCPLLALSMRPAPAAPRSGPGAPGRRR